MNSAKSRQAIARKFCSDVGRSAAVVVLTFTSFGQVHSPRATPASRKQPAEIAMQAARLNNLGVAYMNQQKADKALRFFEQAHALQPKSFNADLNRGIALLNLQRFTPAEAILLAAVRLQPASARAWYNLGILYRSQGRLEEAIHVFQEVAKIDKDDPDTQYFLGFLFTQLQKYPEAVSAFQNALRLNPFHASSEFGLAKALQREGDSNGARQHVARFQHLVQAKLAAPLSLVYGEQGKYSLAEPSSVVPLVPPPIPVHFVFIASEAGLARENATRAVPQKEVSPTAATLRSALGPGACLLDIDRDGLLDIYIAAQDSQRPAALFRNLGKGHFENVTDASGLASSLPRLGCSAGDYDNDGLTDLAVADSAGVHVFHNEGNGKFKEVTTQLGIKDTGAFSVNFVDYDHDGDLDLYVTHIVDAPLSQAGVNLDTSAHVSNSLWRNNGNGTFTEVSRETGVGGGTSSLGALATDFNNDRAVDFVVTSASTKPIVLLNPREGAFRAIDPWQGEAPGPTTGVIALDFDKDGWMDLAFSHFAAPGLTLWRNLGGSELERVALPKLNWVRGFGLVALDYDNDGWIDIAAVGETEQGGEIRLFRNRGPQGLEDVTHATGLDKIKLQHPRALLAGDFDQDGDTDLLIAQNGGDPILLRNDGGNRNSWIRLALHGLNDNKSATGTKVEVYAGTVQQKWETVSSSGYLSRSSPEVLAGLGDATQADVVRMLWPTGVV